MTNPILFEGAKVRQALINQALADPNMTMGFETEFYVLNAAKRMAGLYKKNSSRSKDRFWYVKKLGDLRWYDLLKSFTPLGAEGLGQDNQEIVRERMDRLFQANFPEAGQTKFRDMFGALVKKFKPYGLITALRVWPDEGFDIEDETALRKIKRLIAKGDRVGMVAYKNLDDESYRQFMIGEEDQNFDPNDSHVQIEVLYQVIAEALEEYLGEPVVVRLMRGDTKTKTHNYSTWAVTMDNSLDINELWEQGMVGVEVVSPIKPAAEGLKALHKVLLFIQNIGRHIPGTQAETNQATGLHINIGKAGADVDYVKLLFLMGDAYIAQNYDRLQFNKGEGHAVNSGVMAAQTYYQMVQNFARNKAELMRVLSNLGGRIRLNQQDIQKVIELFRRAVPKQKYFRVNLTKLDQGYIEFRAAGNSDYEDRWSEIEDTCLQLIVMMYVATTPEVYRKEFLTKLYKVAVETGRKHFEQLYRAKQFYPKAAE